VPAIRQIGHVGRTNESGNPLISPSPTGIPLAYNFTSFTNQGAFYMAITLSNPTPPLAENRQEMPPAMALRFAWITYVVLLFIPFLLFVGVIWSAINSSGPSFASFSLNSPAVKWCIGSFAYLALVVPCAIFWRSHVFQAYWKGERVAPSAYLQGMLTVWIALEIGGILSLVGCLASDSMMPGLLPAAVAFVLFTPLWPSGRAMVNTKGDSDDPAHYQEPR
jgi:hypothetical protein